MLRARTLARLAVQLAGVGLVGVGLVVLTMGGTAMAAARAADPTPPNAGTSLVAAAAAPTTITSKYSCDLSGYGTSLPAVTLSATVTIPASVAADASLHITLATTASDDLPAAVITALKGVTEFGVTGELAQQPGATGTVSPVSVAGSAKAPASVTALPAVTATGSAVFTTPGTGVIMAPAPTLTIAPLAGSTTLAHITCTTTAAIDRKSVV